MPPLLKLADEATYRAHYERTLCRGGIFTHDGIPVFFRREEFDHAFFESSTRRGENDVFSPVRAERMDWIAAALADPGAQRVHQVIAPQRRDDDHNNDHRCQSPADHARRPGRSVAHPFSARYRWPAWPLVWRQARAPRGRPCSHVSGVMYPR